MLKRSQFNSIRQIVRLNTLLFITVFVVLLGVSGAHFHRLQKQNVYSALERTAETARIRLDIEFDFFKRNLQGLRNQLTIFEINSGQRGKDFYKRALTLSLLSRPVQFNTFFAFDQKLSEKYFGKKGYIQSVHRDPELFNSDDYYSDDSLIEETFTDPGYQTDPDQKWYQMTRDRQDIAFTNIYFDRGFMKQWVVTVGLGYYDSAGQFQGMVGIDLLLNELVRQFEDVALGDTGGVLLVDLRSNQILTRLKGKPGDFIHVNERYDQPAMGLERLEKWKHLISVDHSHDTFIGDSGETYIVSTKKLEQIPWVAVAFQQYKEAFWPLYWQIGIMIVIGAIGFALLIWVSIAFSRSIHRPIRDLTASLLENIRSTRKNQIMKVEIQTSGYLEIQRVSRLMNRLIEVTNQKTKSYLQFVEEERAKALHSARMASVGQMAGNAAHEINSPLAAIALHAELLFKEVEATYPNEKSILNRITNIRKITDRIAKIVKGFLAISREGKSDPVRVYWLQEILQETLDLCQSRMKASDILIEVDPIPNLQVRCRGVQISQALLNLLNNSSDAIQDLPDKWIRVEFQVRFPRVAILVTDSGPGISPDLAQKIMEPFFTTKDVNKGTGLGLSISRSILEEHGGRLYYDPRYENTCFVMELPIFESRE